MCRNKHVWDTIEDKEFAKTFYFFSLFSRKMKVNCRHWLTLKHRSIILLKIGKLTDENVSFWINLTFGNIQHVKIYWIESSWRPAFHDVPNFLVITTKLRCTINYNYNYTVKAHCRNFVWLTVVIYTCTYTLRYVYIIINWETRESNDRYMPNEGLQIGSHLCISFQCFRLVQVWSKTYSIAKKKKKSESPVNCGETGRNFQRCIFSFGNTSAEDTLEFWVNQAGGLTQWQKEYISRLMYVHSILPHFSEIILESCRKSVFTGPKTVSSNILHRYYSLA